MTDIVREFVMIAKYITRGGREETARRTIRSLSFMGASEQFASELTDNGAITIRIDLIGDDE